MLKTVSFFGICPARSELVMASRCIVYAYELRRIRARFPVGCNNLMALRFLIANDDSTATGGNTSGVSVLAENGQVDYVVGDGDTKDLDHSVEQPTGSSFLKVRATNDDFSEHGVDVQMTIEALVGEE